MPLRRKLSVRVKRGKRAKRTVTYGTVINPGLVTFRGRIVRVLGPKGSPSGLVLSRGRRVPKRGQVLAIKPSGRLPHGVLARVTSVRKSRHRVTVRVKSVPVTTVTPVLRFKRRVRGASSRRLAHAAKLKCGSDIKPYKEISNIRLSGSIDAVPWRHPHAELTAKFDVSSGVDINALKGKSCELSGHSVPIRGLVPPGVPVYATFTGDIKGTLGGAANLKAGLSLPVTLGAKTTGLTFQPNIGVGKPHVTSSFTAIAGFKGSAGLGLEGGIGDPDAGNLHVALKNSLDLSVQPGNCNFDLNLGSFSSGGKIGPFSIKGPSHPPFYHRNLWHNNCGAATGPNPNQGPGPGPGPGPKPFSRAQLTWDTETDVDLHIWDEQGHHAYFDDQKAIPNARLVEDVIPGYGPEYFEESASPGRRYTYGICQFSGDGANVTLTVTDPNGSKRTVNHTLNYEKDSALLTTSPDGGGYTPPDDWCG